MAERRTLSEITLGDEEASMVRNGSSELLVFEEEHKEPMNVHHEESDLILETLAFIGEWQNQ